MPLTSHAPGALPGFAAKVLPAPQPLTGAFCCDLLSLVISRAPEGCAWVTVIGNVNTVAVATLCGAAAIVVAEGMRADPDMLAAAEKQGVAVFTTDLPVFEAARAVDEAVRHAV